MNNTLFQKLEEIVKNCRKDGRDSAVIVNTLKEYLQYVILDFVYNSKKYSNLIMYGGTVLRMCYGLERMSEDLDFQTEEKVDLDELKNDLVKYFKEKFNYNNLEMKSKPRDGETDLLIIKFPDLLKELRIGSDWSTLKIRVDINFFSEVNKFSFEYIPVVKDNYVFTIKTYTFPVLMASKVAAVFLRDKRNTKGVVSDYKGRDIFDLIWYMKKKAFPDLDYLRLKGLKFKNYFDLFNKIILRVGNLDEKGMRNDLPQFFYNNVDFDDWISNWRAQLIELRKDYQIYKVIKLLNVFVHVDFMTGDRNIRYEFETEESKIVKFVFNLTEYWYEYNNFKTGNSFRNNDVSSKIVYNKLGELKEIDHVYIGLFYKMVEEYLQRNDWIVTQAIIKTKRIRATADSFNPSREILLNKQLLISMKLESLLC